MVKLSKFHLQEVVDLIIHRITEALRDKYRKKTLPLVDEIKKVIKEHSKCPEKKVFEKYGQELDIKDYIKKNHKPLYKKISIETYRRNCSNAIQLHIKETDYIFKYYIKEDIPCSNRIKRAIVAYSLTNDSTESLIENVIKELSK